MARTDTGIACDNSSFPYFTTGVFLYRTPLGGHVVARKSASKPWRLFPVTRAEMDILLHVNGQIALSDLLIGRFGSNCGTDVMGPRSTLLTLVELANSGFLRFGRSATLRKAKVKGSTACFVPFHMLLELTAGCNLACRHCYASALSRPDCNEMKPDLATAIMEQAAQLGVETVQLSGGEPLCHSVFDEILDAGLRLIPHVSISTNGTLISPSKVRRWAKWRRKLTVQVSLDGPDPQTHDAVRGKKGAFDKSVAALHMLLSSGIHTRACVSVFPETASRLLEIVEVLSGIGVRDITYVPVLPWGRGKRIHWESVGMRQRLALLRQEDELHQAACGLVGYIEAEEVVSGLPNCGAGSRLVVVDAAGTVMPCPTMRIRLGTAQRQSFQDILAQPLIHALAKVSAPGKPVCERCSSLFWCRACMSRGMARAGEHPRTCRWFLRNAHVISQVLDHGKKRWQGKDERTSCSRSGL